jgi:uncharacterized RDD family membrane protein YckC
MMDQRLVDYIKEQMKNGYKLDTIQNTLIQRGYDANNVNECIAFVRNEGSRTISQTSNINVNEKTNMSNPEYVGFWARLGAIILDGIIIGIPSFGIQFGLVLFTGINSMMYIVSVATLIFMLYMEGIKGGTPGKLIIGVRVVNEKGEYIGMPSAFLRYIGKILSGLILGIGYFMIGWDAKKQGLHDKIAKTYVIRK